MTLVDPSGLVVPLPVDRGDACYASGLVALSRLKRRRTVNVRTLRHRVKITSRARRVQRQIVCETARRWKAVQRRKVPTKITDRKR